ncbi:hypothetical protein ACWIGI_22370 [Nocardia sp. NPDC055321]
MISQPANQSERDVQPGSRSEDAARRWRRRSPLTWIALASCAYLAVMAVAFGLFPPTRAGAFADLAHWQYRLGAAAFGLACATVFAAAAVWIWRRPATTVSA